MHKIYVMYLYKDITLTCNDSSFLLSFWLLPLQSQDAEDMTLGWFDGVWKNVVCRRVDLVLGNRSQIECDVCLSG